MHTLVPVSHRLLVFFSPGNTLSEMCGWRAFMLLWSLTSLLWSFAGQVPPVVLVHSWQLCLRCFVRDVLLATDR